MRAAIKKHTTLCAKLNSLSTFASSVKNSIVLIQDFINAHSKLKLDNTTRWSSSFLMLQSFKNAFKKGALTDETSPVQLAVIDKYIQVLIPAFRFNLSMQKNSASIADVLPQLKMMLSTWNRFQVAGDYKRLSDLLIAAFTKKFAYEMASPVYAVSSLLNVSILRYWKKRPDFQDMLLLASTNVEEVFFLFENNQASKRDEKATVVQQPKQRSLEEKEDDTSRALFEGDKQLTKVSNKADLTMSTKLIRIIFYS